MEQARSISFSRGKGKLTHTDRTFISSNVDPERTQNNIVLVNQSLTEAYEDVFGEAQAVYNAKQKRKDRKIDDYFCKLFGVPATDQTATEVLKNKNKQQSFYEWVIGVGSSYDTGIVDWVNNEGATIKANPHAARIAAECLTEYIVGNPEIGVPSYEERNPNFHLMKAIVHMDEKTPHLHIDAVPFADGYKNGMTRQQGIAKALDVMGYGIGETAIAKWQESERAVFRKICETHGFNIRDEEKSRGYTVLTQQYGEFHENELRLEEQQAEIAENTKKNTELQQRQSTLIHNVGGLEQQEKYLAENVESLVKNEEGCRRAIDNLEKQITSLTAAQEALTSSVDGLQQKADSLSTEVTETEQRAENARSELTEIQEKALKYKTPEKKHFGESEKYFQERIATAQQAVAITQRTEELDERESKLDARSTELDKREKNIDAIVQNRAKEMAAKPIADARQETAIVKRELTAERTAHTQTRTKLADAIARLRDALLALFPPYWKNISQNAHQKHSESLRRGESYGDLARRQRYQPTAQKKSQSEDKPRIYQHR